MSANHVSANRIFTRRGLITAAIVPVLALGLGLGPAQAQSAPAGASAAAAAQSGSRLTIRDIYDRTVAAGYHDIREIELDKGRYEVKALDAQGRRVKLYVNATSGEVEYAKQEGSRRHSGRAD